MRHGLTAVLIAAALAFGAPAAEAATPPQTAAEQRATQQWLADLARWSEGYNTVMTRRAETLEWLSTSAQQLVVKIDAGQKEAARAYAARVAEEGRARLAAEMQAYQGLSTEAPVFPLAHQLQPSERRQMNTFALMPDRFGTMMIRTDQAGQTFIDHLVPATSGRPEDMKAMIDAYYGLSIARSEAAIAMTESARSNGTAGPIGEALDRLRDIVIANERATILWTRFNRSVELGEPFNAAQIAADLRVQADLVRDASLAMARESNSELVTLRSTTSFVSTPMGQMMVQIHESFVRAAGVEYRAVRILEDAASAMEAFEADPGVAAARLENLTNEYDTIITQRLEEEAARRRLIAQNAG